MISIRDSLSELERYHQAREQAVNCYVSAIQSLAQYPVDFEEGITETFKQYLTQIAAEVSAGDDSVLEESRASLRALLRDYREKASQFLGNLREELATNARTLEEIMESLALADIDNGPKLRGALGRLREAAGMLENRPVRALVQSATDVIDKSLEDIRKQHQITVSQFQVEIRMLHRRIESLETAASIDDLTRLFNRTEMEERLRTVPDEACVLLMRMNGLRLATTAFRPEVAVELAGAFTKRLRNALPPTAVIGRWGEEEFLAIVELKKAEALSSARWIAEHLSGSYACIQEGKAVRPSLQLSVGVAENTGDSAQLAAHVHEFFPAV